MALRARKRQGGSSTRRAPIRPPMGAAINSSPPPVKGLRPGVTVGGAPSPTAPVGAPKAPTATYVRKPPPAPSVATRGATSEAMRANANAALGLARGQNRDSIYRAIMQLGDPTKFAEYAANPEFAGYQFTQDPNSIFASLARQEAEGLDQIDEGTLSGNTFFSGRRLDNRNKLSDETGRQRLAGSTAFSDDLKALAAALGYAESDFNKAMTDADQLDIDAALERDRIARDEWAAQLVPDVGPTGVPAKGLAPAGPMTGTANPQSALQMREYMKAIAKAEAQKKKAKKKGKG